MPAKNTVRAYVPDSFYHVYNRGVEGRKIFLDDEDYRVFLNLLKRYLSKDPEFGHGRDGVTFYDEIELNTYCLMPNHFHLLLYVGENPRAIADLMRRICTSYTVYFNKKYKRVGQLLQGRFRASRVHADEYLLHISRYIHLNPREYKQWPYSSIQHYIGNWQAEWVRPARIYELYEWGTYERFLDDFEDYRKSLEKIENSLANR